MMRLVVLAGTAALGDPLLASNSQVEKDVSKTAKTVEANAVVESVKQVATEEKPRKKKGDGENKPKNNGKKDKRGSRKPPKKYRLSAESAEEVATEEKPRKKNGDGEKKPKNDGEKDKDRPRKPNKVGLSAESAEEVATEEKPRKKKGDGEKKPKNNGKKDKRGSRRPPKKYRLSAESAEEVATEEKPRKKNGDGEKNPQKKRGQKSEKTLSVNDIEADKAVVGEGTSQVASSRNLGASTSSPVPVNSTDSQMGAKAGKRNPLKPYGLNVESPSGLLLHDKEAIPEHQKEAFEKDYYKPGGEFTTNKVHDVPEKSSAVVVGAMAVLLVL